MNLAALHLLEDKERDQLRKIVEAQGGLAAAARSLGLSRGVVASAVGGLGIRRGSIELVRDALVAYRKKVSK